MNELASNRPLVLVLEDEALIALTIQDELQDDGYAVAGRLTASLAALEWLGTVTPAMAILDAALSDGSCNDVAAELHQRKAPFLMYSGHQEQHLLLAEFPHLTWIEKPAPPAVLVRACQQLLGSCAKLPEEISHFARTNIG